MEEVKPKTRSWLAIILLASSMVAIFGLLLCFWWPFNITSYVLWGVSCLFAIISVYGGMLERSTECTGAREKAMATAAVVVGCLVLLGAIWTASLLLAPISLQVW